MNPKNNLAEKVVAICQPNFLPWIGYFEMGHRADVYVMLDDVQYVRREWVNRNKILSRSDQGWQWVVVPLKKKKRESMINEMEIQNSERWSEKILNTLHHVYGKAPFYNMYIENLSMILSKECCLLVDYNIAIIKMVYNILGIKNNLVLSSELDISSKRDDKLTDICEHLGASIYLANNGSKPYIDQAKFYQKNICFVFQDYDHPIYSVQQYTFVPYLSVIDVLFWYGPDALEIILQGRKQNWIEENTFDK